MIVFFQVMTVIGMTLLTIKLLCSVFKNSEQDGTGEPLWFVTAKPIGMAKRSFFNRIFRDSTCNILGLPQGSIIAGNRWIDELYIASAGTRTKLLFNIQRDKLYVSVLKGSILIEGYEYLANKKARISLPDYSKLIICDDIELSFNKRRN